MRPRRADLVRDVPIALMAPLTAVALAWDGRLGRADGVVLLLAFAGWLTVTVLQARRERSDVAEVLAEHRTWRIVRDGVLGLALLVLAGRLIVLAAKEVGDALGWDPFTVGAVLVAIATSTPELATSVAARVRGHDDVSVGTVLGSNIFNGLLVVGVAAVIHPIAIAGAEFAVAVVASVITLLLVIPGRSGRIPPVNGALMLLVYAGYVAVLLVVHEPA